MKVNDFLKYFTLLTIARNIDEKWLEVKYLEKFAPSKGPLSTKTGEWLENNQFIFTFNNPAVEFCQVNIQLEQMDIRIPSEDDNAQNPPFNPKRKKIGFCVIQMPTTQDVLNHFEPKKLVKNIKA